MSDVTTEMEWVITRNVQGTLETSIRAYGANDAYDKAMDVKRNADVGEIQNAAYMDNLTPEYDGQTWRFTFPVSGTVTNVVKAESEAEAIKKSEGAFLNSNFGDITNVRAISIEIKRDAWMVKEHVPSDRIQMLSDAFPFLNKDADHPVMDNPDDYEMA